MGLLSPPQESPGATFTSTFTRFSPPPSLRPPQSSSRLASTYVRPKDNTKHDPTFLNRKKEIVADRLGPHRQNLPQVTYVYVYAYGLDIT